MAFHSSIRKEVSIVLLIIVVKLARLSTFELTAAKLTVVVMVLDLLSSVEVEVEEEARQRSESIDYHQLQFIVTILPL